MARKRSRMRSAAVMPSQGVIACSTGILNLVSVGAAIAFFGLVAAAHYLAGLDWSLALLFGALTCVTGPTVIVPLLRSVRPNARISDVLCVAMGRHHHRPPSTL
ncbi:MAG: hypothetical protein ACOH1L_08670 [Thermomonas sp.]